MDDYADVSLAAYRRLVEHPSFGRFFRTVTPISDVETLHIGSRPSRRVQSDRNE
jgi:phosphoenolpyruvate carboxylase